MPMELDVQHCRRQFPGLSLRVGNDAAAFLDGAAGSQVPQSVIDAVADYMAHANANCGGAFATSRHSDEMLAAAHQAVADFLNAPSPDEIVFGPNMTTLTLALSRAMARQWRDGDEVVVSKSDHDANVTPWVLAARDAGATVRHVEIDPTDCTLDLNDLASKLSSRTRLVAVGCASNASGTIHPVKEICRLAHEAGAEVFLDAVHFAPHLCIDVQAWDCDYLACSAYKFFGPHVGVLWGRQARMAQLPVYKLRPASDATPDRWMTGTQNHEGIAGTAAAVDYLADVGRHTAGDASLPRRPALVAAFDAIARYERELAAELLAGLSELEQVRLWGVTDPARMQERAPTFCFTHQRLAPRDVAARLGDRGIFVWHGNYYALPLTETLGLEPDGAVRAGLLHYNTLAEAQRLLEELRGME